MVQTLHHDSPVARKQHLCSSCSRIIESGEQYDRQDNVFDGQRYAYKCCAQCQAATSWIYRHIDGPSYWDDGFDLRDVLSDLYLESGTEFRLWHYMRRGWRRLNGELVDLAPILGEVVS